MQRAVDEGGDHDGILQDVEGRTEGRALEAVGTVKGSAEIKWRRDGSQGTAARQAGDRRKA